MRIASLTKLSTIDYPGVLSAVVFTNGCNYRCTYCHNSRLIDGQYPGIAIDTVFAYLDKRKDILGGVVITGGEPTVHPDLLSFIRTVRELGYRVKLDTNGSRPEALRDILPVLDYVALDYKAPQRLYEVVSGASGGPVRESMRLLEASDTPWEVRTTLATELDDAALEEIKGEIPAGKNPPRLHRLNKLRLTPA